MMSDALPTVIAWLSHGRSNRNTCRRQRRQNFCLTFCTDRLVDPAHRLRLTVVRINNRYTSMCHPLPAAVSMFRCIGVACSLTTVIMSVTAPGSCRRVCIQAGPAVKAIPCLQPLQSNTRPGVPTWTARFQPECRCRSCVLLRPNCAATSARQSAHAAAACQTQVRLLTRSNLTAPRHTARRSPLLASLSTARTLVRNRGPLSRAAV